MMQRQKRVPVEKKRKISEESLNFNQIINAAAVAYRQGQTAEQEERFQDAYQHYNRVTQLLQQFPLTEWRRSEFRQAMQAIECMALMMEDGYMPDDQLRALANHACKIYHASPGIQCIDFRLTALRMLIARYGIEWNDVALTNDVSPLLTADKLEIIEEALLKLGESILQDNTQKTVQKNARLALYARSFIMMGNTYLRIAQHNHAISSYLVAMQALAQMTIKDHFYIESHYVIFHTLNMHINIDKEYAVVGFAKRLLTEAANDNPDFSEFAALFLQVENQHGDLNQVKLSLWQALITILQQRVNGEIRFGENEKYLSDFPDCAFWEALECPEYQSRLASMQYILQERMQPRTITSRPPLLEESQLVAVCDTPTQEADRPILEYGNSGQILPELLDDFYFYGNNDFMFFGSAALSSPLRDDQSNWWDPDVTPSKETNGFGF